MSSASSFPTTIYHNPACSNSRAALAAIRERGFEPQVIEYLQSPPDRTRLKALLTALQMPVRELMRSKEPVFAELGLDDPALSEDALIDALLAHPVLMNRPIVITPLGVRLCRPGETVHDILPPCSMPAEG